MNERRFIVCEFCVSRNVRKVAANAAMLMLFFASPPRRVRCEKLNERTKNTADYLIKDFCNNEIKKNKLTVPI
jgi:hypothetical protein